jgi:hypothetical protein
MTNIGCCNHLHVRLDEFMSLKIISYGEVFNMLKSLYMTW